MAIELYEMVRLLAGAANQYKLGDFTITAKRLGVVHEADLSFPHSLGKAGDRYVKVHVSSHTLSGINYYDWAIDAIDQIHKKFEEIKQAYGQYC